MDSYDAFADGLENGVVEDVDMAGTVIVRKQGDNALREQSWMSVFPNKGTFDLYIISCTRPGGL